MTEAAVAEATVETQDAGPREEERSLASDAWRALQRNPIFWVSAVLIAVFVLIAASTVMVPVLAYLAARARMQAPLDRLRVWLTANNATVMSVLLLVIGVAIFGKGLAGL